MSKIRIGIIGGGASGSAACKACLEEGFDVVVYERTDSTGGLWRYHEQDMDGVASVAKSTIINSSKEMTAFSDFPPPPDFPNFMHHTKMVKYYDLYGEQFRFERYVRLRHEVIKVEPNGDYDETGKWVITVRDNKSGQTIEDVVNGVMVCTGHHVQPLVPTFRDQDKYKGEITHTHSYKKPDTFADKKVVVIGIGNSGGDAAVELSTTAEKVYLSVRRGTWVMNRVGPNGKPIDTLMLRRAFNMFMLLPYSWVCSCIEFLVNTKFDHKEFQLKPEHRILSQHIMLNDALPNRILSGTVVVKHNIQRFTENGVIFEGETEETPCDAVVLATGYKLSFPFLSQSLFPTEKNMVELYKYVFLPKLKHPKTLAFITLIQPTGALLPIGEMQCRWFAQLMANKVKLPDFETMVKDIESKRQFRSKRFYESERHTIQVDWIDTMDELALEIGAKPNLTKYFFTDPELWKALFFEPCVPYQYRLEGPHSWSGAREAILNTNDRISAPLKTRIPEPKIKRGTKGLNLMTSFLGLVLVVLIALLLSYLFY